jgi:hypothetical protein
MIPYDKGHPLILAVEEPAVIDSPSRYFLSCLL